MYILQISDRNMIMNALLYQYDQSLHNFFIHLAQHIQCTPPINITYTALLCSTHPVVSFVLLPRSFGTKFVTLFDVFVFGYLFSTFGSALKIPVSPFIFSIHLICHGNQLSCIGRASCQLIPSTSCPAPSCFGGWPSCLV